MIGLEALTSKDLSLYSWVAIGIAMFFCIMAARSLREPASQDYIPEGHWLSDGYFVTKTWFVPTAVACMIFFSIPWFAENINNNPWRTAKRMVILAPAGLSNWQGPQEIRVDNWQPLFPNAKATLLRSYFKKEKHVQLYTALFDDTAQEVSDLTGDVNTLYGKFLWRPALLSASHEVMLDNEVLDFKELLVKRGNNHKLIWYWYYVGGEATTDMKTITLLEGVKLVTRARINSGVIAISTDYTENLVKARSTLEEFIKVLHPQRWVLMSPVKAKY